MACGVAAGCGGLKMTDCVRATYVPNGRSYFALSMLCTAAAAAVYRLPTYACAFARVGLLSFMVYEGDTKSVLSPCDPTCLLRTAVFLLILIVRPCTSIYIYTIKHRQRAQQHEQHRIRERGN